MNWEALDDPALVLPRVLDVHGTLRRLGFTGHTHRGVNFYWLFVPLFGGGIPAQFGNRHISHVHLTLNPEGDPATRLTLRAAYGYPERYRKKDKIILGFKPLTSHCSYRTVHLDTDRDLRSIEKVLHKLIDCIQNHQFVCTMQVDTASGVDLKKLEPYEALVYAVEQEIECDFSTSSDTWWMQPEPSDPQPTQHVTPASKYSRLPNFDRRRNVFRHVRRPV